MTLRTLSARPLYKPRWWLPYARFTVRLALTRAQVVDRFAAVTQPTYLGRDPAPPTKRFVGSVGKGGFVIEPIGPHSTASPIPMGIGEFLGPGHSAVLRMTVRQDAPRTVVAIAVHLSMAAVAAGLLLVGAWLAATVVFAVAVAMWLLHVHDFHREAKPITQFVNELGPIRM